MCFYMHVSTIKASLGVPVGPLGEMGVRGGLIMGQKKAKSNLAYNGWLKFSVLLALANVDSMGNDIGYNKGQNERCTLGI